MIRKATGNDLHQVAEIYRRIHDEESAGRYIIGWNPEIYPVEETAVEALRQGDLFVYENSGGKILASAIINSSQLDSYAQAEWTPGYSDSDVLVLHTLTVDPASSGKGIGTEFVKFYEEYGRRHGYHSLRLDTQDRNLKARAFYPRLGYTVRGIADTTFHGLRDIKLVLFEKII